MLKETFDSIRTSGQPIFDGFSDATDVFDNFNVPYEVRPLIDIIYVNYEMGDYDGSATVWYFRRDTEKYYETYGSHCSCYGLEDQWSDEEICFPELAKRFNMHENFGIDAFRHTLR